MYYHIRGRCRGFLYFLNRVKGIIEIQSKISPAGENYNYSMIDIYNRIIMNYSIKTIGLVFFFSYPLFFFLNKNKLKLKILTYTFMLPLCSFFAFAYFAKLHHIAHDFMNMRYLIVSSALFGNIFILIYQVIGYFNKNNLKFINYSFNLFILLCCILLIVKESRQILNFNFLI